MRKELERILLRFFSEDVGGVFITGENGEILYEDERAALIRREETNWRVACPPPREGQRGEMWDLMHSSSKHTYMVVTSTFPSESGTLQIHHFVDNSLYIDLFRDINDYSRQLREEKERDGLTGLFNKGKFIELKQSLFKNQDAIAVFNLDVNNLKRMNDVNGHEAGDKLIVKAAQSLRKIEARNVMPFRVGGDEFIVVAMHVTPGEVEALHREWERGLEALNRADDGVT